MIPSPVGQSVLPRILGLVMTDGVSKKQTLLTRTDTDRWSQPKTRCSQRHVEFIPLRCAVQRGGTYTTTTT